MSATTSSSLTRVTKKNSLENVVEFHSKKSTSAKREPMPKAKFSKVENFKNKNLDDGDDDDDDEEEETLMEKDIFSNKRRSSKTKESNENMSLKQAKFDVFKFGIKGFGKEDQENAKIQMAVKLGAAPPKNKCVNYKELINLKNQEKLEKEQLLKENRLFEAKVAMSHKNFSIKKKNSRAKGNNRKSKINMGNVGVIKGHIGSFSNGVLKIKKNEIKKINK
jgi:hypothetical protein